MARLSRAVAILCCFLGASTAQATLGEVTFPSPAQNAAVTSPVDIVYQHTPACEDNHPAYDTPYGQNMLPPLVTNVATGKNEMETSPGMGRRIVDSPAQVGLDSVYVTAFEYGGTSAIPRAGVTRTEHIVMGLPPGTYDVKFTQFVVCAGTSQVLRFTVGPPAVAPAPVAAAPTPAPSNPAPGGGGPSLTTPTTPVRTCNRPNLYGFNLAERRYLRRYADFLHAIAEGYYDAYNFLSLSDLADRLIEVSTPELIRLKERALNAEAAERDAARTLKQRTAEAKVLKDKLTAFRKTEASAKALPLYGRLNGVRRSDILRRVRPLIKALEPKLTLADRLVKQAAKKVTRATAEKLGVYVTIKATTGVPSTAIKALNSLNVASTAVGLGTIGTAAYAGIVRGLAAKPKGCTE